MSKYKLLGINTESEVNIGDYIQALAASQFLPQIDGYIQRERLGEYTGEKSKVIMNGWYMFHTENWPPSDRINPLFVAFHINSKGQDGLLSDDSIKYLKRHEPIGCRDRRTAQLLRDKGVDAYFSGCLTLTLGRKYKSEDKSGEICFVDPYFRIDEGKWKFRAKSLLRTLADWKDMKALASKYYQTDRPTLRQMMYMSYFMNAYLQVFPREMILNATYINQQSPGIKDKYKTDENLLAYAENLVKRYARAKFVVTSRIHCALPCLGMETPVVYVEDQNQAETSRCRLDGLRELFNILTWDKGRLTPDFAIHEGKITPDNIPANKRTWQALSAKLQKTCDNFIANN